MAYVTLSLHCIDIDFLLFPKWSINSEFFQTAVEKWFLGKFVYICHLWTFKYFKMPMRRHMTVEEASRAMGFLQTGLSQRQVGAQFNVSHTVIGRLWTRYQQTHSVHRRPKSGRSKSTTAHQDRQTALLAKRNRMSSAVMLNRVSCSVRSSDFYTDG
jgi:hypothetical protein